MAEHYIIDEKEHVYEAAYEKHHTKKTVTLNGTYNAEDEPGNITGYSEVNVNVEGGGSATLITKNITENGTYNASSDQADGYSEVTVNVPAGAQNIFKGTTNPVSGTGKEGDIYTKYHVGYQETTYSLAIKNLAMTSNDYTDSNGFEFIASASSVYSNQAQPYKAFNGDFTTSDAFECWHPNSGVPQWIQIQFPKRIIITGLTIYNRPNNLEHPTAFKVQGSDDGETWTDLVEVTWSKTGYALHKDVEIPATQNGFLYYRLYITETTSSPYAVIKEITFTDVEDPDAHAVAQVVDDVFVKMGNTWQNIKTADISDVWNN